MADETLVLSKEEADLAHRIAKSRGISVEEAAELIVKGDMARRVRLRTGKGPARVYSIKKR